MYYIIVREIKQDILCTRFEFNFTVNYKYSIICNFYTAEIDVIAACKSLTMRTLWFE